MKLWFLVDGLLTMWGEHPSPHPFCMHILNFLLLPLEILLRDYMTNKMPDSGRMFSAETQMLSLVSGLYLVFLYVLAVQGVEKPNEQL